MSHDRFFVRYVVEGKSIREASSSSQNEAVDDDEEEEEDDDASPDEDGGSAAPAVVYRLTRTSGRMIRLGMGMDEYQEIVVRRLAKNGIEI